MDHGFLGFPGFSRGSGAERKIRTPARAAISVRVRVRPGAAPPRRTCRPPPSTLDSAHPDGGPTQGFARNTLNLRTGGDLRRGSGSDPARANALLRRATSLLKRATSLLSGATSLLSRSTSLLRGSTSLLRGANSLLKRATSLLKGATSLLTRSTSLLRRAKRLFEAGKSRLTRAAGPLPSRRLPPSDSVNHYRTGT